MAKKKAEHNLPNQIFVKWEDYGKDDAWLRAAEEESDMVDRAYEYIGVYRLAEVRRVRLVAESNKIA